VLSRIPQHWREELGRLIRFGLVGLLNTGVGLGTIYLLQNGLEWDYRIANIIGYVVGIIVSFTLNRAWTFKSRDTRLARQGVLFLLVAGTCWALQFLALIIMVEMLGISKELAQPLGMVVYTAFNYLGNRLIVFRAPQRTPDSGT